MPRIWICDWGSTEVDAHGAALGPRLIDSMCSGGVDLYGRANKQLGVDDFNDTAGGHALISAGEVHMPAAPGIAPQGDGDCVAALVRKFPPLWRQGAPQGPVIEHGMVERRTFASGQGGVTFLGEVGLGTVKDGQNGAQRWWDGRANYGIKARSTLAAPSIPDRV